MVYKQLSALISLPVLAVFALSGLLAACTASPVAEAGNDNNALQELISKVKMDTATMHPLQDQLLLTGKVVPDEDKQIRIYPLVSGIVRKVHVHSGWAVKKGEVLAELVSSEMAGYNSDLSTAEAAMANARRQLSVTEDLFNSGLASAKELEESRNDLKRISSEAEKAAQVLQINGGDRHASYRIKTPLDGFVIDKRVTEHMQLRPDNNEPLFVVADIRNVWAMVNIYESDISFIHQGDSVHITTLSYPDKIFYGIIDKIYQMLDPETKTMRARINIRNQDLLLKPEMFVTANVQVVHREQRVSIDAGALIFDNNRYYVVLSSPRDSLQIRPVEVSEKMGNRAYISQGLQAGEKVVASRQLYFYEALKQ
ncbi:MAG: efflux RND transporter periplasmic adaptor subunit [Candidatus Pseudobacter hemicellulosilyticus]|uniref:Efflux RND transporter periplasmic adaptor subunit n=1 Tax=Candidatus Pseudobacter hemicellulosilyticus TaxID=3121375 RepID=A0AAJ5WKX5_9BACT|nr:MAG: efflux RND transporter periplasmic adaptor subunit [Pseudobacter sp.]